MAQIDDRLIATVPKLDGRADRYGSWRDGLGGLAERAALGLVLAGLAATIAWVAALGWSVLSLIRWAIG